MHFYVISFLQFDSSHQQHPSPRAPPPVTTKPLVSGGKPQPPVPMKRTKLPGDSPPLPRGAATSSQPFHQTVSPTVREREREGRERERQRILKGINYTCTCRSFYREIIKKDYPSIFYIAIVLGLNRRNFSICSSPAICTKAHGEWVRQCKIPP